MLFADFLLCANALPAAGNPRDNPAITASHSFNRHESQAPTPLLSARSPGPAGSVCLYCLGPAGLDAWRPRIAAGYRRHTGAGGRILMSPRRAAQRAGESATA